MKVPHRSRRHGWSLLELLAVMSVLSTFLAIMAGLMFQLIQLDRSERARTVAASGLDRFARIYRRDLHAASAPPDVQPDRLSLTLVDGSTVEYQVRPLDVVRTVRQAGATRFEAAKLPPRSVARFQADRDGDRSIVALIVGPDPASLRPGDAPPHPTRYEAAPGRDRRIAREVAR